MSTTNVGYIGLGNIGKPAAKHLIAEPFKAHVYDALQEPINELAQLGAVGCGSVAELAAVCEHIGICVRDEAQVDSVLYGAGGIFENARRDTLVAIHSTVSRNAILKWAGDADDSGMHVIDAGISGGAQGAEAASLVYMVGGTDAQVARARPVFETSADQVIHAGDIGAGMILKLCNNLITYAEFLAMSEATRLAEAAGLSVDTLYQVGCSNGVVNDSMHGFISNRNALAANCGDDEMAKLFGRFGRLGEKDLDCALTCAAELNVDLPSTERLRELVYPLFLNKA